MIPRRRRWVAAAAVALGLGGAGLAIGLTASDSPGCTAAVVGASDVPPVFEPIGAPVVRTDRDLERLIGAMQRSGLGRVLGAVGYDQTQWLRSAAVPGGFATWTAGNAVIGFRDVSGRIRWGLRQTSDPQAWALAGTSFLDLDLRPGRPVRVASYDPATGRPHWCADVGSATTDQDPLTVAPGSSGSVWVVTAGPALSHIDASGKVGAPVELTGVDRAGYLKQIGSTLVVGGRASHLLTAPDPRQLAPDSSAITAFDAASHRVRWRWGKGLTAHVVGEANGRLIVEVARSGRLTLVALDLDGRQRWSTDLPVAATADVALRDGVVLVRTTRTVSGYDAAGGARRWTRAVGTAFPVGFDLSVQPRVGKHVLLGTTTALVSLDPASGSIRSYALPVSGSSTTFWPYELTASGCSVIVETNAGAMLVALRPQVP